MDYFTRFDTNPVMSPHAAPMYASILGQEMYVDPSFVDLIYDVIRDMHSLDIQQLSVILEYLLGADSYLLDLIILNWCLPSSGFGRKERLRQYKQLVLEQHHKLLSLKHTEPIQQFSREIVNKTCQIPVHCFDLIWPLIPQPYEMVWRSTSMGSIVKLTAHPHIRISIDAYTLLYLGLGHVPNNQDVTFCAFLESIRDNPEAYQAMISGPTGDNFQNQMDLITCHGLVE